MKADEEHSLKVERALATCRSFAKDHIGDGIQWRLDPNYILTLCEEINNLRNELQAAHRWANARAAVVNLSISATDYRKELNELSEAEDALASAMRQSEGDKP